MARILLAEILAQGVRLESHEAVAVAQQLIQRGAAAPAPQNVRLAADGAVECAGCDVTPGAYEMAILLQTLLPPERLGVPGGLRYAIARALHEVEARPFDSVEDLSVALQRFEKGDRRAVVAQLVRRAVPAVEFVPPLVPLSAVPATPRVYAPDDIAPVATPVGSASLADLPLIDSPFHDAVLEQAGPFADTPSKGDSWWGMLAIAAALVLCALGGFATVRFVTTEVRGPAPHRQVAHAALAPATLAAQAAARAGNAGAVPIVGTGGRGESAGAPLLPRQVERTHPTRAEAVVVAAVDGHRRPVFSPAFASNGSALFFHTGGPHDQHSAIATSNMSPGYDLAVMTIIDDGARNYHAQPSPDGRTIAFDSDRDGERGVYLASRNGGNVRRISGEGYAAVPSWSPDGRRLAYIRAEESNPKVWNLWLQSLDDGRETRLTDYRDGQTWSASWFPDGRRICYAHEDRLVILDLDDGREQAFASPVKGRLVRTPAVSPDGSKVIFQVHRQGAWMLNVADGSMQYVLTDPTAEEFAWAPDGRHVAFHSRRDGAWGIYVIAG
jgi:WD40 repeat protein/dipeptidyl peptidase IV (DPP IV)-like protein